MNENRVNYGHNHSELVGGLVMFVVIIVFMAGLSHWMNNKDSVKAPVKNDIAAEQVVR